MSRVMNPVERAEAELAELEKQNQGLPQAPAAAEENPQPAESEPPQAAETPAEPEAPKPAEEDYRQKYFALQGMFKGQQRQIEQLTEQNRQLIERIDLLATVSQQPAQQPQAPANQQYLEALAAEFGEPMVAAIRQIVEATAGNKFSELERRIQGIDVNSLAAKVNTIEEKQTQTDSDKFRERLTQRLPDWEQIYLSDQFAVWKDSAVEPFTARTYGDLFDEANGNWNLEGVAGIFSAFKASNPSATPVNNNPQQQAQTQQQRDPREAFVTPAGRGAGASGAEPQAKVWKQSEVNTVFDNMRRGRYTQEEMTRLDREILEANAQGRIVPG